MSQRPDADTLANAQVLCSETLQVLAKAHLDVEEQLPDAEQSTTVERAAKNKALELYAEAVQVDTGLFLHILFYMHIVCMRFAVRLGKKRSAPYVEY